MNHFQTPSQHTTGTTVRHIFPLDFRVFAVFNSFQTHLCQKAAYVIFRHSHTKVSRGGFCNEEKLNSSSASPLHPFIVVVAPGYDFCYGVAFVFFFLFLSRVSSLSDFPMQQLMWRMTAHGKAQTDWRKQTHR